MTSYSIQIPKPRGEVLRTPGVNDWFYPTGSEYLTRGLGWGYRLNKNAGLLMRAQPKSWAPIAR